MKKMLLLSGPAGCGKSALIHTLAHTHGFHIVYWNEPVNTYHPGLCVCVCLCVFAMYGCVCWFVCLRV